MGSGGGGSTTTKPALSKKQKEVEAVLAPYLTQGVGQPSQAWGPTQALEPGDTNYWYYPQGEGDILSNQLMTQFSNTPVQYQTTSMIPDALRALSPEATQSWYMQNVYPSLKRQFTEEALPAIGERYVGSGNFWSGERRGAEAQAIGNFGTDVASNISNQILANQAQASSMIPQLLAAEQAQAQEPLGRAQVASSAEEMQRQLRLNELQARFEEYKRIQPEYSPIIDQALAYLALQTQMAYGTPPGPSLTGALGGAGTGALTGYSLTGSPYGAAAGGLAGLLSSL